MALKLKFSFTILLVFIAFTVVGTLSHELGHISVAQFLGYDTQLHYGSMNWYGDSSYQLKPSNAFWISLGGPAQTLITSFLGFSFLLYREFKMGKRKFQLLDWIAVFLALFCLRQLMNPVVGFGEFLFFDQPLTFGNDETKLAESLKWPLGSISIASACISFIISMLVLFKFIPRNLRSSFLLGGILGGFLGYSLWLIKFGPLLLP
ncbi:MAG: hypothetical protein RIC95_06555 [Vicingaceae bacterium]